MSPSFRLGSQWYANRRGNRTEDQLVCVSPALCDTLWDLGATTVCRYADKSAYTHTPLPPITSEPCPGGSSSKGTLCAGDCGDCAGPGLEDAICTGRSPSHPFGVCAILDWSGGTQQPLPLPCSIDVDGTMIQKCGYDSWGLLCAVFQVPSEDEPAARRFGVCMEDTVCIQAASILPGGLFCFDNSGKQVAP